MAAFSRRNSTIPQDHCDTGRGGLDFSRYFSVETSMNSTIEWYRTPLEPILLKQLNQRSDAKGAFQAGGHLAIIMTTGGVCILCWLQSWWVAMVGALFVHGTVSAFTINAMHELLHNTVFRSRRLNAIFAKIYAFIGWHNPYQFWGSHSEHHKFTLHPPDDLEVTLPETFTVHDFLITAFINIPWLLSEPKLHWEFSQGRFTSGWNRHCFPDTDPVRQAKVIWWSRCLLLGHSAILVGGVMTGYWIIPVILSIVPLYGAWLFFLCNNTQHCGLVDKVADFRLCARSFNLNPVVAFLYWHMNFHIEHHMYSAVPCYNLAGLNQRISYDLPPAPYGLLAVWREIGRIIQRQRQDPDYQYVQSTPRRD
jgi:fatty acid desaturase